MYYMICDRLESNLDSTRSHHTKHCATKTVVDTQTYMYNTYDQRCSGGGATGAIAPVPIFQGGAPLQFLFHLFLVNFAYILQKLSFDLDYYW